MSYILDALKKAAEQRGAGGPVLLRPSMPLRTGGRLRLPWIVVGVLALLNLAGFVYVMWPAARVPTALPPVPPAKVALIQPIEAPPPPAATQVIPAEPPAPPAPRAHVPAPVKSPAAPPAPVLKPPTPAAVKAPVAPPAAAAPAAAAPIAAAPVVAAPAKPAVEKPAPVETPATVEKAVGNKAVVRITPEPRPAARPAPAEPKPAAVAAAPTKADSHRFKLEVLSYSDVPAQRLVFINGRRYREGDTIDGGATKVEQIREDSVLLNEDGQRFTLR